MASVNKKTVQTTNQELFKRFVEIGRVVYITYGRDAQKVAVVTDIIDQNRLIVHGPTTDVKRQVIPTKWISLTDLVLPSLSSGVRNAALNKAVTKYDLNKKWEETTFAKKLIAKKKKAALTDFERFQVKLHKAKVNRAIRTAYNKLVKDSKKK
eukprot:TRINITY_DN27855_c0_g1_i1.p2 TRINITY_DN27855_c0_g1~~TRINITY_DN27855_c0_g1_i1.p2  ORF type:complete len:162 (+),score=70.24 TRINITY_DN27855_c0_g1_i1:30-488(+)